jgi:hypothetical protein
MSMDFIGLDWTNRNKKALFLQGFLTLLDCVGLKFGGDAGI